MRSLTTNQQRVLAEITWNCRAPVVEVAKKLKLKNHTVRYAIDELKSILNLQPFCFTNAFRLGLTPFRVYFSVNSSDKVRLNKMIEHLRKLPEVYWLYGLYGYYQFGMSLRVPNMRALSSILAEFDSKFGDIITKKSISILARFAFFESWLAHVGHGQRKSFQYTSDDAPVPLDAVDRKILEILGSKAVAPINELAKLTGIAPSTVSYRIDKMTQSGVILGFAYTYENRITGSESFLIQVALKGLGGHVMERLFNFGGAHPRVIWMSKTIGEWDVEMEVGIHNAFELDEIIHQIYRCGQGSVREVMTHAWGRDFKD